MAIHFLKPNRLNIILLIFITEEKLGEKTDFEGGILVSDEMLDIIGKVIDLHFWKESYKDLDVPLVTSIIIWFRKKSRKNSSNTNVLFEKALNYVDKALRDMAGFDMNNDDYKNLCREAFTDEYIYPFVFKLINKSESKFSLCN